MLKKLLKTLRFRLTLWNTIVVLVAALLALFAVRVAMRITIENEARALLREELTELELAIAELHPDQAKIKEEFERKILSHAQHGWFAALLEGNRTIWESENFPQTSKQAVPGILSPPGPDFAFTRTSETLLVALQLTTPDGKKLAILLGEPTEYIRNEIWQLTKIMLLIGVGLALISPVGGYLLARHATRPVREIIATTRALDPSHLNSRLDIRGTGDELDQLSTEINSFVDQISKYINSQRDFVANAAHELRSPITAIQTSVDVTLGQDRSVAEYQEQLATVSEQCQQLRHLVNQLLELAETDARVEKANVAEFDFVAMIRKSIDVFGGIAEEKGITVSLDLPDKIEIFGNEARLRQVVNNLLDNALKFTPDDGSIDVALVDRKNGIELGVVDSGPGVQESDLARIFDRFYQTDVSRVRDLQRGNGLGLSICKSIVELHGGKIIAENVKPKGLRLRLTLPRLAS